MGGRGAPLTGHFPAGTKVPCSPGSSSLLPSWRSWPLPVSSWWDWAGGGERAAICLEDPWQVAWGCRAPMSAWAGATVPQRLIDPTQPHSPHRSFRGRRCLPSGQNAGLHEAGHQDCQGRTDQRAGVPGGPAGQVLPPFPAPGPPPAPDLVRTQEASCGFPMATKDLRLSEPFCL